MSQQQLDKLLKIFARQAELGTMSIEQERAFLDDGGARFVVPDDVVLEPTNADGIPAEFLTAAGANPEQVVLYLHGGGYVIGSIKSHRYLMQNVSRTTGARTLGIDYRRAPEHPFPAALDDALKAYRWLLNQGFAAKNIAIAGDSAGGGLTLSTLLKLRDLGEPLPAAGALISPWADLTGTAPSVAERAAMDPCVTPAGLAKMAAHYLNGTDGKNPFASPVFAELHGLPPLLVHVGGREILYDDSLTIARKAKAAGVDVTLVEEPDLFHVWHAYAPMLEEAQASVAQLGAFLRERLNR